MADKNSHHITTKTAIMPIHGKHGLNQIVFISKSQKIFKPAMEHQYLSYYKDIFCKCPLVLWYFHSSDCILSKPMEHCNHNIFEVVDKFQ